MEVSYVACKADIAVVTMWPFNGRPRSRQDLQADLQIKRKLGESLAVVCDRDHVVRVVMGKLPVTKVVFLVGGDRLCKKNKF